MCDCLPNRRQWTHWRDTGKQTVQLLEDCALRDDPVIRVRGHRSGVWFALSSTTEQEAVATWPMRDTQALVVWYRNG
jgi:hypothetical protein